MKKKFDDLIKLSRHLRGHGGCPWDREQSLETLTSFIIEEAYEVVEAIESRNTEEIVEELGDLFYQIIFACQISNEENKFDIDDVMDQLHNKLVRRHPHVFGDKKAKNAEEALKIWHSEKLKEKKRKTTLLDMPRTMPALLRAQRVGEKASNVGFDWNDAGEVLKKVEEEISELKTAIDNGNNDEIKEEWGDLVFTMVNLARHLKTDAEYSAHEAINKFVSRFSHIEEAKEKNKRLDKLSLEEMDEIWEKVKST